MSLINAQKTADHISNWIKDYANKAGISTLVLGLSGGVDSALVALLCKRTGKNLICVNMPCHSSNSAYLRASNFAREFELNLTKVDISSAHEVILEQAKAANFPFDKNLNDPIAVGGLRSCLRTPTLSYFANSYKGLIVGTGNRSEDNIIRYFQKYGDGCVDISPISDLFKSEVYELFAYLSKDMFYNIHSHHLMVEDGFFPPGAKSIYDAKPTADLWGADSGQEDEKELGISYDEIEWADRENMRTIINSNSQKINTPGIIFDDRDPTKHPKFFQYTGRQQQVIAKMHQLEKISRHKVNPNLPCCQVREVEGLVK